MARRLHVPPKSLQAGPVEVTGPDFRYLCRVLRLAVGDEVILFEGEGREARARITRVDVEGQVAVLEAEAPRLAEDGRPPIRLELLCPLLKGDKMELVVQKATEIGATRIVPVTTARAVVRLDEKRGALRVTRWRKIAREAARQCGRVDLPEVAPIARFAEAVQAADGWRVLLFEGERERTLRSVLPASRPAQVVLAVGPEGGFDEDEVKVARDSGFTVVGLGPRVLRAETACLVGLALLAHHLSDLG